MIKIDKSIVEKVTWEQDPDTFDQRLHALGNSHEEFIIVNPKYEWILDYIDVDSVTSDKCIVWSVDNLWLVKKFKANWTYGWDFIPCELELDKLVEFNPEVKFLNSALKNKILNYKINIEDANSEHVWYVDPQFNSIDEKVWIARIQARDLTMTGAKDMGYLKPEFIFNPDLPKIEYSIDIDLPYHHHDYSYDLVWYLDDDSLSDKVWIAKFVPDYSQGLKDMGSIIPNVEPKLEFNPDIPDIKYNLDINVSFLDLVYEHVWYLDPKFNPFEDDVWAVKLSTGDVRGVKNMGYVSPEVEYNPAIPESSIEFTTKKVPYYELNYNLVWYLDPEFNLSGDKIWALRINSLNEEAGVKDMGFVGPAVEYNKDIPSVELEFDQLASYIDFEYELVWYLDPAFNQDSEKIWVKRITPANAIGVKDMGYARPRLTRNTDIPLVEFDFDINVPYQDLSYEHVWYLDPKFNTLEEKIWVFRTTPKYSMGEKDMGFIHPKIIRNPAIPDVDFEFADTVAYYELKNDLIWYLDSRFNPTEDNIWAIKILTQEPEPGLKDMGTASPRIILNPDLPKLDYYINDHIPYYDLGYEHVWMLDSNLHSDKEEIWAAKIVPNTDSLGVKEVGKIGVMFSDFDVVFISYNEPNAEANWYKLKETFPDAKRVKNVKGIFEAHKRAAEVATTDMFYVVDGDAEIIDSWKFDYKPNVFDMDCVHLWTSLNPINDLEYGYGGVKLFPRQMLLDATTWRVDLTTGLGKLKFHDKVSNITGFNTDPFGTWRSAFRECAKLSSGLQSEFNAETEQRLDTWTTKGQDRTHGEYALHGAKLGKQYGADNYDDLEALKLINNYEWMKNEFDKFYKH